MENIAEIKERILKAGLGVQTEKVEKDNEQFCPECGMRLVPAEGCVFCPSCGWSPCK